MHLLLDNLIATIVGMLLLFTMITSSVRQRQVTAQASAFYASTAQTESFLQILRRDLQGVTEVHSPSEDASTLKYSFDAQIGSSTTIHTITYKREKVKTKDDLNIYRIVRLVDGVAQGGSADIITDWQIATQNEEGQPLTGTSSLGSARQIYVHLETTAPFGTMTLDRGLTWESTFVPPLLSSSPLN